jgi:hypothetical protein
MRRISTVRRVVLGSALAVLAVSLLAVAPADAAKRAYCRQPWGSLPKQVGDNSPGFPPTYVTGVSASRSTCHDRLVIALAGPSLGYRVEYVAQATQDGSGDPIPLRGGAFLQIVDSAAAYDVDGRPTYRPADRTNVVDVRGFSTFRQAAFGGSFEGLTTFGLGVRARLPFRVTILPGPGSGSRVVLDVSHRWI